MNINDGSSIFKVRDQRESIMNKTLINLIYPVGTIYITENASFNPNNTWGGTWVKTAVNRFLQGTNNSGLLGSTVEAGLPNITGSITQTNSDSNGRFPLMTSNYKPSTTQQGSLSTNKIDSYHYIQNGGTDDDWKVPSVVGITFNASSSNSIYGRSSTVQPPAEYVFMWKRTA